MAKIYLNELDYDLDQEGSLFWWKLLILIFLGLTIVWFSLGLVLN